MKHVGKFQKESLQDCQKKRLEKLKKNLHILRNFESTSGGLLKVIENPKRLRKEIQKEAVNEFRR